MQVWDGQRSQPACGGFPGGDRGQTHQHTEATQDSNLGVGKEEDGDCRRPEEGVAMVSLGPARKKGHHCGLEA